MPGANRKTREVKIYYDKGFVKAKLSVGGDTNFGLTITEPDGNESQKSFKLYKDTPKIVERNPKDGTSYSFKDPYDNRIAGEYTLDIDKVRNENLENSGNYRRGF